MVYRGSLILKPIRASLFARVSPSSSLPRSRIQFYEKFEPLKALVTGAQPVVENHVRSPSWRLYTLRCYMNQSGVISRGKVASGTLFGASVVFGSICLRPRIAYAMNGFDILGDDHHLGDLDASGADEDRRDLLAITRKFLLPFLLFITVLMNWNHPIILAAKVILILVGTKPSPLSVYLFIEQLRRQFMHEHPIIYRFKVLRAALFQCHLYTHGQPTTGFQSILR